MLFSRSMLLRLDLRGFPVSWLPRRFLILCLAAAGAGSLPAQVPELEPTGYVNDFTGVLSPGLVRQLDALGAELKQKTGAEVAVAVIDSLGDESLENFANILAERWGVGDEQDRGALLLFSIKDRLLRVEIGYGLEPIIPDGRAGDVREAMIPHLRDGDYDAAIATGMTMLAAMIAQDAGVQLTGYQPPPSSRRGRRSRRGGWWPLLLMFLFFLPRRRRRGGWRGGGITTALMLGGLGGMAMGGGGRGGYISGGGGFGGFGGGGFGGGGASGSW